jgi:hypothetical protein
MCHADQHWSEALPVVLLGFRTSFKEDLQASVAELVYSETLRIPGEFLTPSTATMDTAQLIQHLHSTMAQLRPVPATRHASPASFVHKDLRTCTHVFLRQDASCRNLEPPYSGPYRVISHTTKTFKILIRNKTVTVSADIIKPAYMLTESDHGNYTYSSPSSKPSQSTSDSSIPHPPSARTTRSSRHVHFPTRFLP